MSTGRPVPKCMKTKMPKNAFESPIESHSVENAGSRQRGFHDIESMAQTSEETQFGRERPVDTCNLQHVHEDEDEEQPGQIVSIRDRICCFQWTWFAMTMATGGMANVLYSIPYRSEWLNTLGIILLLLNIFLFSFNCIMITLRFKFDPGSFRTSFNDQSESLFIGTSLVSFGTILINICQYGISASGLWLQYAMMVVFWMYAGVSMLTSCFLYLVIWSTQAFPLNTMTPLWVMPAYPLLLVAPFASNFLDALASESTMSSVNSVAIVVGAITLQGAGFMISMTMYSSFLYRLMTQKLPKETLRPGIFISVGPAGFTVAGLVQLGSLTAEKVFPAGYMVNENAAFVLKVIADLVGLWLWGLCIWCFIVSVGSHWDIVCNPRKHKISFAMNWYSFVFPNTALVTATQQIGKTLGVEAIQILGTVMAALLAIIWLVVFLTMIKAIISKRLLWPEKRKRTKRVNRCNQDS